MLEKVAKYYFFHGLSGENCGKVDVVISYWSLVFGNEARIVSGFRFRTKNVNRLPYEHRKRLAYYNFLKSDIIFL